jgi:hypothetical protein
VEQLLAVPRLVEQQRVEQPVRLRALARRPSLSPALRRLPRLERVSV